MFGVTLMERISTSTQKRNSQNLNRGAFWGFLWNLFARRKLHWFAAA